MLYPAWFDLINDDAIVSHPIALWVYTHLLREPLAFVKPQDVKTLGTAEAMKVHPDSVQFAINLLIARGYSRLWSQLSWYALAAPAHRARQDMVRRYGKQRFREAEARCDNGTMWMRYSIPGNDPSGWQRLPAIPQSTPEISSQ